jgi:hypothetical protein
MPAAYTVGSHHMNELILVIALLSTESSYKSEIERPATAVEDTIQFSIGAKPWRIRTYAIDHDIHIYSIGGTLNASGAVAHIDRNYLDILKRRYTLKFKDPKDPVEVARVLASVDLRGTLEVAPAGFAFYNPDRQKYHTQSTPK